jgi:uncharacterized protein
MLSSYAWDVNRTKIQKLEVVLKTTEICNLKCTFCYHFFGGDESYKGKPNVIHLESAAKIIDFLVDGVRDLDIKILRIIFHGGEPMLQPYGEFSKLCSMFTEAFRGMDNKLEFSIQSNGTLVTDEWIDALEKHCVSVGISIDGPKEYSDIFRIDSKGKSSYTARTVGISKVLASDLASSFGALAVMDFNFNYTRVFNHLVEDLKIKRIGFLLPDRSHEEAFLPGESAEIYGQSLCDIFDCWITCQQSVVVRNIENVLSFFQLKAQNCTIDTFGNKGFDRLGNHIITIHTDGSLAVDDTLIPASNWYTNIPHFNVDQIALRGYLSQPFYDEYFQASRSLPVDCVSCCWRRLCMGGDLENRFSIKNGFDNPSVYCGGLKIFYEHVVKYLCNNGYPIALIEEKLVGD